MCYFIFVEAPIEDWVVEESTSGLSYDKDKGEVTVLQPGYYHIYAQVRGSVESFD